MKILFVTFPFPPYNSIGAVRTGRVTQLLAAMGHEVKVLAASDQPLRDDLHLDMPPSVEVVRTPWINVNRPIELALGGRGKVATKGFDAPPGPMQQVLRTLGGLYKDLINFPDGYIGWTPIAIRAGAAILKRWRADIILSSSPPTSSMMTARALSVRFGIPWVAELRDLWTLGPLWEPAPWRAPLEKSLEQWTLSPAAGMVTVSEPLAQILRDHYHVPVEAILNGFDPAEDADKPAPHEGDGLNIVYTGMIYPGRRDPTPLFEAIASLGADRDKVHVHFYGRYQSAVETLAEAAGIPDQVHIHGIVGHDEARRLQREADALLLMIWRHPTARDAYTGKLFEYIAARRPMLAIIPDPGVAADLIRDRQLGAVADTPDAIAGHLRAWLDAKRRGALGPTPASGLDGLSREAQVHKLDAFLRTLAPN